MKWLRKIILSKYVKGLLDKLPLNGLKTYTGLLIIVISALISALGEGNTASEILKLVLEKLQSLDGYTPITDAGIVVLITGIVHKVIKWIGKSQR